jgi:hypothetical protein
VLNPTRSLLFATPAFVNNAWPVGASRSSPVRYQLGMLNCSVEQPHLCSGDLAVGALLSRRWVSWSDALVIVKPPTVIRCHRAGSV